MRSRDAAAAGSANEKAGTRSKTKIRETPFEAVASICSVLVVGLFILTFLAQNFVIPSGSMEHTLMVGDHLMVDRITLAAPTKWMPLVRMREPQRGDIIVFKRPAPEPELDADGNPQYLTLVKRLVGVPGDHIHLHDGVVYLNGVAQSAPKYGLDTPVPQPGEQQFLDEFPAVLPKIEDDHGAVTSWVVELPTHIENGELVVPPGKYFMMGDHRHGSMDSRFWGFVPRENIMGRPLFNYWSFKAPNGEYEKTGLGTRLVWMGHVAMHFFTDTRWKRTLARVN
jgi:signal peptidase I